MSRDMKTADARAFADFGNSYTGAEVRLWVHDLADIVDALRRERADMLTALREALDFAEDQEDISDGPDGEQVPNKAMVLAQSLREVIAKAEGST